MTFLTFGSYLLSPFIMAYLTYVLLCIPIVVTPHVGYATKRTRIDAASLAAQNVLRGLAGEPMLSPAY